MHGTVNAIKRVIRELRKNSLADFVRKALFYSLGKGRYLWAFDTKSWQKKKAKNVFGRYATAHRSGKEQVIVFVLPGVWIAGGIAVILRYANLLQDRGYRVKIVTQDLKTKVEWFENQRVSVVPINAIESLLKEGIDILIATGWNSVPTVDLLPARRKIYFVQLDERRFYQDKALQSFVGETYRVAFEFVTMARFLEVWLREEFEQTSAYIPNGLDVEVFRPGEPYRAKTDKTRVLIEGPINIPFKGVAEAYEAVSGLDCEIWLVSGNGVPPSHWQYDQFFEKVPLHEMPRIYRACDILLKMSTVESFCYPPLEMMACGGVPVILEVSGIEEYARDKENCLIVKNKQEAREAVARLIADSELRARLARRGLETAQEWSWSRSLDIWEKVILMDDARETRR
jgi:glycosyltransferase involved in cell wall biosynthesis